MEHRGVILTDTCHERQRAVDRSLLATCNGTVEGMLVLDLGGIVDVTGKSGRTGGEVDHPSTLFRTAYEAIRGKVDVLDVLRIAQHGEDHVSSKSGRLDIGGPASAPVDKALGLLAAAGVNRQLIASIHEMPCDGGTHDTSADEGDLTNRGACHTRHYSLSYSLSGTHVTAT